MRRLSISEVVTRAQQQLRSSPEEALTRLEAVLKRQDHVFDKEYADLFLVAGEAHRLLGDYRKAIQQFEQALHLYRSNGPLSKQADCLHKIGTCYIYLTEPVTGLSNLLEGLNIREKLAESLPIAHSLNALGVLFLNADDYEQALNYFLRASEYIPADGDRSLLGSIHNNMGEIHFILIDYHKALEHFNKSLELRDRKDDRIGLAYTHNNLGNTHVELGDYFTGFRHLFQALELRQDIKNKKEIANSLLNIGIAYDRQGEYSKAVRNLTQALRLAESTGSSAHVAAVHKFLGMSYAHLGKLDAALTSFEQALSLSRGLALRRNEYQVLEQMALLYEEKKQFLKALQHLRYCHAIHEDILGAERQRAIARVELRVQIDALQKQKELQSLRAEKAEHELELRSKQLSQNLLGLVRRNAALKNFQSIVSPHLSSPIPEVAAVAKQIEEHAHRALDDHGEWRTLDDDFAEVHASFLHSLHQKNSTLTPAELRICILIRMHFSVNQIADLLFTSPGTVKQHRNHIRRKLDLQSEENLQSFLIAC